MTETNPVLPVPGTTTVQDDTDIASGGTAVIVVPATTAPSLSILIKAKNDNTGAIYIGGSTVSSTGASDAMELLAGESWAADLDHRKNPIYINNANVGDGVFWQVLIA